MRPFAAIAAAAISAAAMSADRHPGIYDFVPASPEYCREQAAQQHTRPARPQRLGDMPAAYAIRLKDGPQPKQEACVRLRRVR